MILVVEVDEHRVGLLAEAVVEVHRAAAALPLPGAPPGTDGVIDVHGEIVAVIDPRARLGGRPRPPSVLDHVVLVQSGDAKIGLRVDRASDVVEVPISEIQGPADVSSAAHVRGVVRLDDGLLLVHDIGAFLSEDEATALGAALVEFDVEVARP